jgi:hypothetical protein
MEKDDPERDNKLNRAAFLLTQITNDGSKNMACLFATKNKQYGKVFGYQINHGISSFQDDIIICKDMSKCLKEDTTNMKNILSLFSLAINNKSQFANKIITTKDKTIKFSWVEIPDPKKPDKTIKEFKSEIVDNDDNLQNDENTFYIKNSNIQDFLKTTTGTNKGVEEDKDFVKDLHGVVDTFTEIMENKNIIEFKKILNNKLNDNDIESFGKSVEEFVTNFENSNKIKDQNLLFVQDAIDYADNIKDYLNKEYSKSNDKITELNNAIAPKYDIILKTLYNSAIEICEEKDGKYSIKKDVSGADDYKDCTRKINDTLTNITKYSNIKDFVNACTQNNKNPLDHIGSNINNISTYKKYSDDIKDIVNAANTKIDIIKRGLEKKLEVLKGENYEEYTENKHDDKVNRQGKRTLTHKFANNPEVFNRHTKEIHYVK